METFDSVIDQVLRGMFIATGIFYVSFMSYFIIKLLGV